MKSTLNITNGDCAVTIMKQAKIKGDFLPWRDALHDGPVPSNLTLEELSKVRAKFISDCDWGNIKELNTSFIERDNTLKSFKSYKKIILWFEHDLYDQLQLIQILDWFHQQNTHNIPITIICTDHYLGLLSPKEMKALLQYEEPITEDHLNLAQKAWLAFRSNTPKKWQALLKSDLSALPFLEGAVIRLLEEYPNDSNGLSRTAMQALSIIAQGEKMPIKIFRHNQIKEARVYLGDASFWLILNELLHAKPALISLRKL